MNALRILLSALALLSSAAVCAKSLSLPEIEVLPISDSSNNRQYELYVKLPESYEQETDKHYPVIYYTDAMWHVELLSAATSYVMEEAILVGISWQTDTKDLNADVKKERGEHVSRFRDYSFYPSENEEHQAKYRFGEADTHLKFIREDVISFVEGRYRTQPDNRTYFGYSMGGSFGAYILMSQPDSFKNYILGSPSVRRLSEMEANEEIARKPFNANVFIAHGTLGNEIPRAEHVYRFIDLLNKREDPTLNVKLAVIEGTHSSAFPATGLQSVQWLIDLQQQGDKG